MNEQRRMQYLDAMGIDMFVPRFVLAGAALSSQCELPVAKQAAAPAAAKGVASVLDGIGGDIGGAVGGSVGSAAAANEPAQERTSRAPLGLVSEPEKPKPQKSASSTVSSILADLQAKTVVKPSAKFFLQLWRVHADLLVVDSRKPGQALPTDTLLTNILKAYGQLPQSLPRAEKLQWPMVDDATKDHSWTAAQEMVQSFLEGRLLSNPVKHILLFGDDAIRAVLGGDAEQSKAPQECFHRPADAFACEAYCMPSLGEILLQPLLKRPVWHLLLEAFPSQP